MLIALFMSSTYIVVVFPVSVDVLTTLAIPRPRALVTVVRLELANDSVMFVLLVVVDTTLTTLTSSNRTDDVFASPLRTATSITYCVEKMR